MELIELESGHGLRVFEAISSNAAKLKIKSDNRTLVVEQRPQYHTLTLSSEWEYETNNPFGVYSSVARHVCDESCWDKSYEDCPRNHRSEEFGGHIGEITVPLPYLVYILNYRKVQRKRSKKKAYVAHLSAIGGRRSRLHSTRSYLSRVPLPNMYGFMPCSMASSVSEDKELSPLQIANSVIQYWWDAPSNHDGYWGELPFWDTVIRPKKDFSDYNKWKLWTKMSIAKILAADWPKEATLDDVIFNPRCMGGID